MTSSLPGIIWQASRCRNPAKQPLFPLMWLLTSQLKHQVAVTKTAMILELAPVWRFGVRCSPLPYCCQENWSMFGFETERRAQVSSILGSHLPANLVRACVCRVFPIPACSTTSQLSDQQSQQSTFDLFLSQSSDSQTKQKNGLAPAALPTAAPGKGAPSTGACVLCWLRRWWASVCHGSC